MRFLPLPVSVVPVVTVSTIVICVWLGWASVRTPHILYAPGDLSRFHADVVQCTRCHQPFRGPMSSKCVGCHTPESFTTTAEMRLGDFHQQVIRSGQSCFACHTEHRGPLAQITVGFFDNPHGEFVFLATGTSSCRDCHALKTGPTKAPALLDNVTVRDLLEEGDGAHVPGKFANCLACHMGGRGEVKELDDD
jgi:hypothetical protein